MDAAKTIEKPKLSEVKPQQTKNRKRKNTSMLIRAKHHIDEALVSLHDFNELHSELSSFREKLWNVFVEVERNA